MSLLSDSLVMCQNVKQHAKARCTAVLAVKDGRSSVRGAGGSLEGAAVHEPLSILHHTLPSPLSFILSTFRTTSHKTIRALLWLVVSLHFSYRQQLQTDSITKVLQRSQGALCTTRLFTVVITMPRPSIGIPVTRKSDAPTAERPLCLLLALLTSTPGVRRYPSQP